MTTTITVADLATELGFTIGEIGLIVSKLCREQGPTDVVHTAAASRARTVLHGSAADLIRDMVASI